MDKYSNKIIIKHLLKKDVVLLTKLVKLFKEVFEEGNDKQPQKSHLTKLLSNNNFIALVIIKGDNVIGGLTAYELPLYYNSSELYIYDMAVKSEFQRQGLGKKLIAALKKYCKSKKIKVFFVEAHEKDKHAVNFYRSAGGKPEKVVHFNFPVG